MTIGIGQIVLLLIVIILLFGNLSDIIDKLILFLHKFKENIK